MRAISLPSLDARISTSDASRIKQQTILHLLNEKGDWLDRELKKVLPRDIYAMAHNYDPPYEAFEARQEIVKKWIRKHDYRIEEHGVNARLFHGAKLLSQFFVKLAEK